MKCPFQWIEKDNEPLFRDSSPVRMRRFIECEGAKCPAYIPSESIGEFELPAACGRFPNSDRELQRKQFVEVLMMQDFERRFERRSGD